MTAHKPPFWSLTLCALTLAATGAAANPVNLIGNADFEAGFSGFGTDYRVSASGCIGCVGVAATTTGWYNAPGYVHPFGDHSSGSGQMLQYDPPASGQPRIWYQSVNVDAGTTYEFTGWLREANSETSSNNGRVGVYADGLLLGTQDAPDGYWAQWSFSWTALSTGVIELALRDLYPTTYNGTYSAIDDLRFAAVGGATGQVPAPGSALLTLAALGLLWQQRRRLS